MHSPAAIRGVCQATHLWQCLRPLRLHASASLRRLRVTATPSSAFPHLPSFPCLPPRPSPPPHQVIMATNRADTLDPALLRPGRLDRKIEFPLPDRRQKRLVFQVRSRGWRVTLPCPALACLPCSIVELPSSPPPSLPCRCWVAMHMRLGRSVPWLSNSALGCAFPGVHGPHEPE